MNQDFAEMLRALSDAGVEFLVVGAHARAAYGEPRATKDLDIWVRPSSANAKRVWDALVAFGAALDELAVDDLEEPGVVFQLGVPPYRIDILTEMTAVEFDQAWTNRTVAHFAGGTYPVIGKAEYILSNRATGRGQQIVDADHVARSPLQ